MMVYPALSVVACAGPVIKTIGQTDIEGTVSDRLTGRPLAGACVTEALDRGGFWTQPGTYLIAQACTDAAGRFRMPAHVRRVYNAAEPDAQPSFEVTADGYRASVFIPSPKTLTTGKLALTLERSTPVR